jgi:ADP-ribose pyrophosphatase
MDRQIIRCDCVSNGKYIGLWSLKYRSGGKDREWVFVSRKNPSFDHSQQADAVVIVALHDRGLVVTQEFRAPLWGYEYGFPAGLLDANETPEEAARREIKEETGLCLTKIELISPPLYSSAGLSDEAVCMVFGHVEGEISSDFLEESEEIDTVLLTPSQALDLCNRKDIKMSAKAWPIILQYAKTGRAW